MEKHIKLPVGPRLVEGNRIPIFNNGSKVGYAIITFVDYDRGLGKAEVTLDQGFRLPEIVDIYSAEGYTSIDNYVTNETFLYYISAMNSILDI